MKNNTLITITRQYGSGGREVSAIVAKKLGLRRYDRKIVEMAAKKMRDYGDMSIDDIIKDSYTAPDNAGSGIGDYAFERIPYFNRMYVEQAKVILGVAKNGSAVFLGRCADYILKDFPNTYSFFIYADDEFRLNRAKDHYGSHSIKDLDNEDKNRQSYYAYYTGQTWGEPKNYDLMINTSKISLEKSADLIIKYIELQQQDCK
ncbi:MAG TPA: cytidylate kinase-like family protein [Candidatus Megamonas gallistercoris]|nr:cytidylate kinase-like family protein [Candidatus Megamonas gallistercoris]